MAKKTTKPKNDSLVVQDFSINVRTVDWTRKTLETWRQARQSATSVINPIRKLLYDLYEDILSDEHLSSVIDQRRLGVTSSTLVYTINGKPVDAINKLIATEGFESLIKHLFDSKLWGFTLCLAEFTKTDALGNLSPNVELVPRAHVIPSRSLVVPEPTNAAEGIDFTQPPYPNTYCWAGDKMDLGLLFKAAPLVLMKRGNISDWADFNQIFGRPFIKGTYDPLQPQVKAQLDTALANVGGKTYMTIPDGSDVELMNADSTGASDTYNMFDDREDAAISKLILLQTMTTEDGSSESQAKIHAEVAKRLAQADRQFILRILNTRVKWMLIAQGVLSGRAINGEFQYIEEEEQLSKKDRLEMDILIHEKVGKLPKAYFAEEYNVEFVDDSDEEEEDPEEDPQQEETGDDPEEEPADPEEKNLKASSVRTQRENLLNQFLDFFFNSPEPVEPELGAILNQLYGRHTLELAGGTPKIFLKISGLIKKGVKNIFNGFNGLIEPNLFNATNIVIQEGISAGVIEFEKPNKAFLDHMAKTGQWFAARKTYRQQQELAALLAIDGRKATWSQFRKASRTIVQSYNETWLKTEYDTAVRAARMGSRWKEFEASADLYPNLEYTASRSATPRDDHKKLYGVIRPLDDDFWVKHYPPSDYNCKCGAEPTDTDPTPVPDSAPDPAPGLDHNPGKTNAVFNLDTHPYSQNLTDDQKKAIDKEGEKLGKKNG